MKVFKEIGHLFHRMIGFVKEGRVFKNLFLFIFFFSRATISNFSDEEMAKEIAQFFKDHHDEV